VTGRPTLAVAMHDGFYGAGTGAGYANHGFLHTLTTLLHPGVRLVVLPVRLAPESPEYQPRWHRDTHTLLVRAGASVHPVDNGTAGMVRFGGLTAFRHLAADTADRLTRHVLPGAGPLAVILFDVPFLGVPPLLSPPALRNVTVVPRSTALLHDPANTDRIHWERHGLHTTARGGGHIAAISVHMRHHLENAYHVPDPALTELPDGLTPTDHRFGPPDPSLLPPAARRGFLLAMGRAQPYKGFDDLIDALALLRDPCHPAPHTVLAAVTDHPPPPRTSSTSPPACTPPGSTPASSPGSAPPSETYSPTPPYAPWSSPPAPNPSAASRSRHTPRAPPPSSPPPPAGLAEQIIDGVTGLTAAPANPESLAHAIRHGLALTPSQRHRMRRAARRFVARRYDHTRAVRRFLQHTAPWATSP